MTSVKPLSAGFGLLAAALLAAGCGSSSSSQSTTATPSTTSTTSTTAAATNPPPAPRLRIISPRAGSETGTTVTVRVSVHGAAASSVRYIVDKGRAHPGAARFTISHLTPGMHRLVVMLASDRAVRAVREFVVQAPPAPVVTTTTPAPPPTTTTAPPPTTTTPPPTTTTGGIPQGNGGDMDSDNNGGPSDGDGNI